MRCLHKPSEIEYRAAVYISYSSWNSVAASIFTSPNRLKALTGPRKNGRFTGKRAHKGLFLTTDIFIIRHHPLYLQEDRTSRLGLPLFYFKRFILFL